MSIVPSRAVGRRAVAFVRGAGARRLASPGPVRVSATLRSFSSQPSSGDPPTGKGATNDLPSHAIPSDSDFRTTDQTGMAYQLHQQQLRQEAVRIEQETTAEKLRMRELAILQKEEALKKVKVGLVFEINGVKLKVAELDVAKDDIEKVMSAHVDAQQEPTAVMPTCVAGEFCRMGLDKESIVQILKVAVEKMASSGKQEEEAESEHSGSTRKSTFERLWAWLKAVCGKRSDEGMFLWLWALVFDTFDWDLLACMAFLSVEGGITFNWDLLVNLFQVYKDEKLEASKSMVVKARIRLHAAAILEGMNATPFTCALQVWPNANEVTAAGVEIWPDASEADVVHLLWLSAIEAAAAMKQGRDATFAGRAALHVWRKVLEYSGLLEEGKAREAAAAVKVAGAALQVWLNATVAAASVNEGNAADAAAAMAEAATLVAWRNAKLAAAAKTAAALKDGQNATGAVAAEKTGPNAPA